MTFLKVNTTTKQFFAVKQYAIKTILPLSLCIKFHTKFDDWCQSWSRSLDSQSTLDKQY